MSDHLLPVEGRPRFARKMVAVWRWHHMARGEEMTVFVWPGEWPDAPREVAGAAVKEGTVGGAGGVLVLGRVGEVWRGAYQLASRLWDGTSPSDLAIACAFTEVDLSDPEMKVWLHPDPVTGDVPMWAVQLDRGAS
jgi:hypothetical protein